MKKYCITIPATITLLLLIILSASYIIYINLPIRCKNIQQLNNLLGIEINSSEIESIDYTFDKSCDPICSTIIMDIETDNLEIYDYFEATSETSPGLLNDLSNSGKDVDNISYYGIRYEELKVNTFLSTEYRPYYVYLISYKDTQTLTIVTSIPQYVNIDEVAICKRPMT